MPTADELVRSLVREGENAGCAWTGHVHLSPGCNLEDPRGECWPSSCVAPGEVGQVPVQRETLLTNEPRRMTGWGGADEVDPRPTDPPGDALFGARP